MLKLSLTTLLLTTCIWTAATAQDETVQKTPVAYMSTNMDGHILSSSFFSKNGGDAQMTTPRYTMFFHFGLNLNFDLGEHVGVFTGMNIKNIGFIEKIADSTIKRRTYTIGIPLGLKIGNIKQNNYFMLGGGVDFPFNYREKGFVRRGDKTKFNEWFSTRTPAVLPYVFVGARVKPGLSLKLQYYPGNFLNPDFIDAAGLQPYKGYEVNLIMATMGIEIPYRPKKWKEVKAKIEEHQVTYAGR